VRDGLAVATQPTLALIRGRSEKTADRPMTQIPTALVWGLDVNCQVEDTHLSLVLRPALGQSTFASSWGLSKIPLVSGSRPPRKRVRTKECRHRFKVRKGEGSE
jgi:hypothetical protein